MRDNLNDNGDCDYDDELRSDASATNDVADNVTFREYINDSCITTMCGDV